MTQAAVMETPDPSFPEDARTAMGAAPGLVFLLVASADGSIDRKEMKCFQKLIGDKKYAVLRAMMEQSGVSPGETIQQLVSGDRSLVEYLATVGPALDENLPGESARAVKMMLFAFAKEIAESSGGFLGLFGGKISDEEVAALAVIAQALGLANAGGEAAGSADKLDEVPGNLYPVLKASEWGERARGDVLMRTVTGAGEGAAGEPVVAYAIDTPTSVQFINADQLGESLTAESLHAGAIANLERRLASEGEWGDLEKDLTEHGFGVVQGVVFVGDFYCAEALLSETLLKQAHERLDSALLMVTAPERGKLFATHLVDPEQPEPEKLAFMHFAVKHFFSTNDAPIAPTVWISRTGKIVGVVEGMEKIVAGAERIASRELEEKHSKLLCSASKTAADGKFGVRLDVVAKDIDVMLERLQHVVREHADKARRDEAFNWQIEVNLSIEDPAYDRGAEAELRAVMDDMFAFLSEQFRTVFGRGKKSIELTYKLAG